jgi:hypothetical protein
VHDIDPVHVCIQQGVVGIGWHVSQIPLNADEYMALGEIEYGDVGWRRAANAIVRRMNRGDLVWVRDFFGIYYIGKVTGEWEYRDDPENQRADIINVWPCTLYEVGTNVAGSIVNCFRPAATVQQVHDETAVLFSTFVYNERANDHLPLDLPDHIDIFSLLSDVDLEDVVGLYIQQARCLIFIPSSRSRQNNTIFYEYQLVDPANGTPVFVQVKGGDTRLDPRRYYKFPHEIYLFSPAGYVVESEREHVVCINRGVIENFLELALAHHFLPPNIAAWLKLRDRLEQGG